MEMHGFVFERGVHNSQVWANCMTTGHVLSSVDNLQPEKVAVKDEEGDAAEMEAEMEAVEVIWK